MGIDSEFDFSEYPDFLHSTYEVTWVGLSEQEARQQYDDVIVIQMPPYVKGLDTEHLPLPLAERTMLYGFTQPELSGFQKLVADGRSRGCSALTTWDTARRTHSSIWTTLFTGRRG